MIPPDEAWYHLLRRSVEHGLNLLIFPDTAQVKPGHLPHTFLRPVLELDDVQYGDKQAVDVIYPESFGGGRNSGMARAVESSGDIMLRSSTGVPLLVRRTLGKGAVWLAGWDSAADSPDGPLSPEHTTSIEHHSLVRLARHLGLGSPRIHTGQRYLYKEWLHRDSQEFLLAYSHFEHTFELELEIKLDHFATQALDASTGEQFTLRQQPNGRQAVTLPINPRVGRYLMFC